MARWSIADRAKIYDVLGRHSAWAHDSQTSQVVDMDRFSPPRIGRSVTLLQAVTTTDPTTCLTPSIRFGQQVKHTRMDTLRCPAFSLGELAVADEYR